MARKTFSTKQKQAAVQMMILGNLPQKQIAKKFGCSLAALQLWRSDPQYRSSEADEQEDEWEKPAEETTSDECECQCAANQKGDVHELMRKFWNKNYRGVDMLLSPKCIDSTEVVTLVNEAMQFVYNNYQK